MFESFSNYFYPTRAQHVTQISQSRVSRYLTRRRSKNPKKCSKEFPAFKQPQAWFLFFALSRRMNSAAAFHKHNYVLSSSRLMFTKLVTELSDLIRPSTLSRQSCFNIP